MVQARQGRERQVWRGLARTGMDRQCRLGESWSGRERYGSAGMVGKAVRGETRTVMVGNGRHGVGRLGSAGWEHGEALLAWIDN